MVRRAKVWQVYPSKPEQVREVSSRHGLPELVARILLNRGLADPEDIQAFLEPSLERLHTPFGLADLETAAARLVQAVRRREPVAIHGDYDVDGLTATTLLHRFFRDLGLRVLSHVPDRLREGYGLKIATLQELRRQASLLVTVDCGVSDVEEVAWAREHGLEVIVTDHHELPPELPPALAVVNPKRAGAGYPFVDLAGVGVALLLALGLRAALRDSGWFQRHPEPNLKASLDLVALGTAADIVPLIGQNRILVRQGLEVLSETRRPGLVALREVANLEGKTVSLRDLVFRLAPRLNAAGRLGQARGALELLLADDLAQARVMAQQLNLLNRQRQSLEEEVLKQAEAQIRRQGLARRPVMVLAQEGWHAGVIGIAASRLVEEYHRPVALVAIKEGVGRGSARSIPGFHLHAALQELAPLFLRFGGHRAAAGFEIRVEDLPALQQGLEEAFYRQVGPEPLPTPLQADAQVALAELDDDYFQHLERLRPFGPGNPEPVFILARVDCVGARVVGERHLRLQVVQNGCGREVIAFDQAAYQHLTGPLELAVSTRLSFFQGKASPELRLLDWGRPQE